MALALQRAFPVDGIEVDGHSCIIGDAEVRTPEVANDFIVDFDDGEEEVEPFTFTLELPEP